MPGHAGASTRQPRCAKRSIHCSQLSGLIHRPWMRTTVSPDGSVVMDGTLSPPGPRPGCANEGQDDEEGAGHAQAASVAAGAPGSAPDLPVWPEGPQPLDVVVEPPRRLRG